MMEDWLANTYEGMSRRQFQQYVIVTKQDINHFVGTCS